jgi:hypothetical protein
VNVKSEGPKGLQMRNPCQKVCTADFLQAISQTL